MNPLQKPLISIITIVYNGEKFLRNTIESVINQTYDNIEYIIIDGGSKDGTIDIIKEYEDKISYWISESDRGIYNAMNKGIRKAKGVLVGIINSDDWYELNTIEKIVKCYNENKNYDVYHGLLRNICDEKVISINGVSYLQLARESLPHPATFIKKKTYDQYGLYDEQYKFVADYEFFLRIKSFDAQFLFIEEILANFRIGGVTTKSNKYLFEKFKVQYKHGYISSFSRIILSVALFLRNILLKK